MTINHVHAGTTYEFVYMLRSVILYNGSHYTCIVTLGNEPTRMHGFFIDDERTVPIMDWNEIVIRGPRCLVYERTSKKFV